MILGRDPGTWKIAYDLEILTRTGYPSFFRSPVAASPLPEHVHHVDPAEVIPWWSRVACVRLVFFKILC